MAPFLIRNGLQMGRLLNKSLEAELILAEVLGLSREAIFAHPERELSREEASRFEAIWQRIEAGEPLAYVLGRKEFFGLEFVVDRRVLIPRPETEHLVEAVLRLVEGIDSPKILDVGTGCGAIALALKSRLPQAEVCGSDVSSDALEVARLNAERLGLSGVHFICSDLLSEVPADVISSLDVMVANLPYIGREEFHFVEAAVDKFEPAVALYGGKDGLDLYRRFFDQINCSIGESGGGKERREVGVMEGERRNTKEIGGTKVEDHVRASRFVGTRWILGEFGSLQRERLEEIFREKFPDAVVAFHNDLAGLDRFFVIDRGSRLQNQE